MKNNYLIRNLDKVMDIAGQLRKCQNQFMGELIHSSFLIAHDEEMKPIIISIDCKEYALIFSSQEEFVKAFPGDNVSSLELGMNALVEILKQNRLGGYILNISSQNFYLTGSLLKGLDDLPSNLYSSNKTYTTDELKKLRHSIDNSHVEEFIRSPGTFNEFLGMMSKEVLFALVESDRDMDILECGGIIDTCGLEDKYDYYSHDGYVALFTREKMIKEVQTLKFRYLSLANFTSLVHHAIKQELRGIVINPYEECYVVPIDVLVENWSLINRTCWDERLASADYHVFLIGD